ncbi:asparagine synthetase B family protein [Kordia jejudonensis]|uniref:asparagine synthetase B family protein n=1 Tax=Kordia jejudonensis TaxID=1348245 RepID=UPI00062916F5|nr:asparagine synthase-related protein [Kordia jejudonensis]
MCGIVMTFGSKHEPFVCKEILKAQRHRGQDDQKVLSFADFHVGFNRLAIVDSSALGNQPFTTERYITVFNGEIYNYKILKTTYNIKTKGTSDIEIIAPLFQLLGESIIDVLDGFYAGIIIDKQTKECFFLKDYIGKKPLFYINTPNYDCVASELKGIEEITTFNIIPKGFSKYTDGTIQLIREHQIDNIATTKLKEILHTAVLKRIPENTMEFGVFLSGGLDSSIIAAIVAKQRTKVTYYCLGDENSEDNRYVNILAKALNIQKAITYIPLPKVATLEAMIPSIIYHTESYNPSIISNGLATYLLSQQAAKDGLKVVLTGEGADELFCGYTITKDPHYWLEARETLIKNLHYTELRRLDRASMAATIEARCPFLDRNVFAIAQQLGIKELIHTTNGLQGKQVLRKLFKNDLPASIIQRKKMSCDVGSGIRKVVVAFSTKQDTTERLYLQSIWNRFFPSLSSEHTYFSSYPVFDTFIAKRKAMHKDANILQTIETLLLADYQQTPFHNLLMKVERTKTNSILGGTCSDKTLHFKAILAAKGIQTQLHTAHIGGVASHRLLSVCLYGKRYFIDIGSGWPCIKLLPAFESSSFSAFGIEFKTKLTKLNLIIDIKTSTVFKPLMIIPLQPQSQTDIETAIANRFHPSNTYPFQYEFRLSFVKGHQFFFIKGNRLRVYETDVKYTEQQVSSSDITLLIAANFPQLSKYYQPNLFKI